MESAVLEAEMVSEAGRAWREARVRGFAAVGGLVVVGGGRCGREGEVPLVLPLSLGVLAMALLVGEYSKRPDSIEIY